MLVLRDGYAMETDLDYLYEKAFKKDVGKSFKNISVLCARDIEDIIFVTGTTITGDWDAVFVEAANVGDRLIADVGVNSFLLAKTSTIVRKYPNQRILKSSGHYHDIDWKDSVQNPIKPLGIMTGPDGTDGSSCSHPKNQCVFIRYFTLKRRRFRRLPAVVKRA